MDKFNIENFDNNLWEVVHNGGKAVESIKTLREQINSRFVRIPLTTLDKDNTLPSGAADVSLLVVARDSLKVCVRYLDDAIGMYNDFQERYTSGEMVAVRDVSVEVDYNVEDDPDMILMENL